MAELIRFNVGLNNGQSELYKYIEKNKAELKGHLGAEVARLAEIGLLFCKAGGAGNLSSQLTVSNIDIGNTMDSSQDNVISETSGSNVPSSANISQSEEFIDALGDALFD